MPSDPNCEKSYNVQAISSRNKNTHERKRRLKAGKSRRLLLGAFLLLGSVPCAAQILTFEGQNGLPMCAYGCSDLYAAQFSCNSRPEKERLDCFCEQATVANFLKSTGGAGVCDSVCPSDGDKKTVAGFLEGKCSKNQPGSTATTSSKGANGSSKASPSEADNHSEDSNKALQFWKKNWPWFLIGFLGLTIPLVIYVILVPVRRYYRKRRRNTTPVVWSNVGHEDYVRPVKKGKKNTANQQKKLSKQNPERLTVHPMLRSASSGSESDASKSFLGNTEYGSGAHTSTDAVVYATAPAMEAARRSSSNTDLHHNRQTSAPPTADQFGNRYTPTPPHPQFQNVSSEHLLQQQSQHFQNASSGNNNNNTHNYNPDRFSPPVSFNNDPRNIRFSPPPTSSSSSSNNAQTTIRPGYQSLNVPLTGHRTSSFPNQRPAEVRRVSEPTTGYNDQYQQYQQQPAPQQQQQQQQRSVSGDPRSQQRSGTWQYSHSGGGGGAIDASGTRVDGYGPARK